MKRYCENCKHSRKELCEYPCSVCNLKRSRWEPIAETKEDDMGKEDDDLQAKLDEANEYIDELNRKLRAAQIELATMRGTIEGLKFSARCNGVSGAEVH